MEHIIKSNQHIYICNFTHAIIEQHASTLNTLKQKHDKDSISELLSSKDRSALLNLFETHYKIRDHDWLLTTYETLRDYQASFGQIRFSCVVFDEIQKAKNPRGLIYNGAKGLNRDFVLGLTGTPVENSLSDLWTIMDVISPGRLGDLKTFMSSYPEPRSENAQEALKNLKQLSFQLYH